MKSTISPLKLGLALCCLAFGLQLNAQNQRTIYYDAVEVSDNDIIDLGEPQIKAHSYKLYQIDTEVLRAQLEGIAQREDVSKGFTALISFPHPDGNLHEYQAVGNRTLSKELNEQFPEIRTYDAADKEGRKVKWDITNKGLHVMIM